MNDISQFTFFRNYWNVIKELPNKEEFVIAILEYVFEDKKPDFKGLDKGIWDLIEVPLNVSKRNGKNGKSKTNPKKIENKSKKNREIDFATISISSSISNSVSSKKEKDRVIGEEKEKTKKNVIEYLNNKIGSNYKTTTKSTIEKINARLNEGYSLDDFIAVIDKKADEWLGTEMEKYLRPETLFGTKFESYLNQKVKKVKSNNPFDEMLKEEKDEQRRSIINAEYTEKSIS